MKKCAVVAAIAIGLWGITPAQADIKVGVVVALTGPNASLGIPMRKGLELLPEEMAGEKIQLIFLDDASDPSSAVKNAQKLISDNKVDLLIGGSNTPASQAMANVATREQIQQISLAPASHSADKNQWLIAIPQPVSLFMSVLVKDMQKRHVKNVAYIGFSDPWGDLNYNTLKEVAGKVGIQVVTDERFARSDTTVTGQILKILAAKPDAVMVGGASTPGALPHIALSERSFKGPEYATPGVFNKDFLRIGGKGVEGVIGVTGPIGAHEQLPASNPIKKASEEFIKRYEGIHGNDAWNSFTAFAYDAVLIIEDALPRALARAKPGTPEFRKAVRDEIRNAKELVGTHGVYRFPEGSSYGVDERSIILVQVKNGEWKYLPN